MTVQTVTGETIQDFILGNPLPVEEAKIIKETPAEEAKPKVEEEAKPVVDEIEESPEPAKKPKLEQRFSELTEARKRAERERDEARKEADELRAKVNPKPEVKIDPDVGPEPQAKDYGDAFEYAKDLAKWSTDKALKDRDAAEAEKTQKAEQEKTLKIWQKRVTEIEKELPDYREVLASADSLAVGDDVRDAIIESEVGPKILYHLASNPDEVDRINGMTVRAALRAIGKLEAKFEAPPEKKEQEPPKTPVARVKPPEPITPIRANSTPDNKLNSKGEFSGTYGEWKALRKAGKV